MEKSKRYRVYSVHLEEKFGQRVYKLPINLVGTCPNRDGNISLGGCIFCDAMGAGFDCLENKLSIKEQVAKNKKFMAKRFRAKKFISYFQAFTNTYMPLEEFKRNTLEATEDEDIVGLSISTRPDCIRDDYLDFLKDLQEKRNLAVDIELGLQTVNYHSLEKINRGHSLAEYLDAVLRIKKRGFEVVTHLILNLPWDEEIDVLENAKILSSLGIDYVKLHSLYILKNTALGEMYKNEEFKMISREEYIERVILFLEHLDPEMVVQRLVGRGPKEGYYFNNWDTSWWKIKDTIEDLLEERDTYQGKKFDYLNGKALRKFE